MTGKPSPALDRDATALKPGTASAVRKMLPGRFSALLALLVLYLLGRALRVT